MRQDAASSSATWASSHPGGGRRWGLRGHRHPRIWLQRLFSGRATHKQQILRWLLVAVLGGLGAAWMLFGYFAR